LDGHIVQSGGVLWKVCAGEVGAGLSEPFVCVGLLACGAATAGAADWSERQLAADSSDKLPLFGIDCTTVQLCVTVGGGNTVGSSTNPTGDASAWKVVYASAGAYPGSPNQGRSTASIAPRRSFASRLPSKA
jgi:hypothetical protein